MAIQLSLAARKHVARSTVISKAEERLHYFTENLIFSEDQLTKHWIKTQDQLALRLLQCNVQQQSARDFKIAREIVVSRGLRSHLDMVPFKQMTMFKDIDSILYFYFMYLPEQWQECCFKLACFLLSPRHKRNTIFITGLPGVGKSYFIDNCLAFLRPIGVGESTSGGDSFAWSSLQYHNWCVVQDDQNIHLANGDQIDMMKCVLEGKSFTINPKYAPKCSSVPNKVVLISNADEIKTTGSGYDDRITQLAFNERYYWRFRPTKKLPILEGECFGDLFKVMLQKVKGRYSDRELAKCPDWGEFMMDHVEYQTADYYGDRLPGMFAEVESMVC